MMTCNNTRPFRTWENWQPIHTSKMWLHQCPFCQFILLCSPFSQKVLSPMSPEIINPEIYFEWYSLDSYSFILAMEEGSLFHLNNNCLWSLINYFCIIEWVRKKKHKNKISVMSVSQIWHKKDIRVFIRSVASSPRCLKQKMVIKLQNMHQRPLTHY